jgi:hypothetical protein
MGSHGGATAPGQRHLLAHYGVTEELVGAPIRDDMAARSLGVTPEGVEAFIAEAGWQGDGVLLLNRVKPHTDFKGPLESGLAKMCAIGLGKYEAARECHRQVFGMGLGKAIRAAAGRVIESGKIIGGVAILENAYHETARIEAVALDDFFAHEERLLIEAKRLMGRLPLDEIDVLICDRMGKNISGAGIDTNIIGRSVYGYEHGRPWHEGMPVIHRIVVRDLADESDGNAVGMGMVDFVPRRFARKVNEEVTVLNATTARSPENAKWPIVLQNDRECLRWRSRHRQTGPADRSWSMCATRLSWAARSCRRPACLCSVIAQTSRSPVRSFPCAGRPTISFRLSRRLSRPGCETCTGSSRLLRSMRGSVAMSLL